MKVSFLTEGGREIGFGHLTRCLSISQAFEEQGITPEFIIVDGDDSILDLLENSASILHSGSRKTFKNDVFGAIALWKILDRFCKILD